MEQCFKYKLAISICTKNRVHIVREVLRKMAKILRERDVGLYLFDESNHNNLKQVIDNYRKCGYDNIHYFYYNPANYTGDERYRDVQRGSDYRVRPDAEYVWLCSDKSVPNREGLDMVLEQLDKGYDIIVYNALFRKYGETKEYSNKLDFFRECTVALQMMSVPVLKHTLAKEYTTDRVKNCLEKNKYVDMEVILQKIAQLERFKALQICMGDNLYSMLLRFDRIVESNHIQSATTMYYFVERVTNTILCLPNIYNKHKTTVMKSISGDTWFSLEGFARLRSGKGYHLKQCIKYLDKLKLVTDVPVVIIMGIAVLPPSLADILCRLICKYKHFKGQYYFS